MIRLFLLAALLLVPTIGQAINIENAKKINRSCALCHGVYGQGTPGTLSPRLAGLPAEYLAKEMRFYRDGVREYAPMVVASSIKKMTDEDIRDISEYLAGVNLRNLNLPKIPEYQQGDHGEGKEMYLDECKSCHKKTGLGKAKKGIPPLAGQYGSYLFNQMKKFQAKERHHDEDPEDDTFDEWADNELDHLVSFLTRLPPHGELKKAEKFMMGMEGMSGVSEQGETAQPPETTAASDQKGMAGMINDSIAKDEKSSAPTVVVAGDFRITPTGEIILHPNNQDLRPVAGLSGKFKVTPGGLVFIPE